MPSSWTEVLRSLDPDRFGESLTVRRRAKPVPPDPNNSDLTASQTSLHDASTVPLAMLTAALSDCPHAGAVIDDDGYVVHATGPTTPAQERGWVRCARLYDQSVMREALASARPLVTVADGGEDLLVPLVAPGTPPVGALVLGCNPAQVGRTAVAVLLQAADATALAMHLAQARSHNERLVGSIGHELRQPLSALVTALDLAGRATPGMSVKALQTAQRQARHIVDLVDALLDASRIASGKLQVLRRLIDLRAVADNAVEAVHADVSRQQQHLRVHVPDRAVWCLGDPARLQQVIVNLLSNASRFTPPRGEITLSLSCESETVMLAVADTGEGFEADVRERIFDPFAQETQSQGLGLGLAISRAIAELHGGALVAESGGRGHGSIFVLQLPGVLERTREIRDAVNRTRQETHELIERARVLRTAHDQIAAPRQR